MPHLLFRQLRVLGVESQLPDQRFGEPAYTFTLAVKITNNSESVYLEGIARTSQLLRRHALHIGSLTVLVVVPH